MSAALKTFGALGIALVGLVVYLSTYLMPMLGLNFFYGIFYYGLVMTFVMIGIIMTLCFGKTE